MNNHRHFVALSAITLIFALPLAGGCGGYANEDPSTGGTGGTGQAGTGGAAGSPPASCTNVTACGGDVVGAWTVADSCLPVTGVVDVSGFGLGCTEATVTGSLEVTGTFTAVAPGMFTDNTITSGQQVFAVPPSCLMVSGVTTTCDRIAGPFEALGFSTVACVSDTATGGCTCTATAQQMGGMAFISLERPTQGSYTIANNTLTTVGEIETQYDYCVAGNTMTMSVKSVGKTGTVSGTIVLHK